MIGNSIFQIHKQKDLFTQKPPNVVSLP